MPTLIKCCDLAPRAPHMPKAGPVQTGAAGGGARGHAGAARSAQGTRPRARGEECGKQPEARKRRERDRKPERERPRPQATMSPLLFDAESAIHSVILTHWQARGIEEGRARKTKGVPNW